MLATGVWKPDFSCGDGSVGYFIDRTPTMFPLILQHLRSPQDQVDVSHLSQYEQRLLSNDIDFYQLSQLQLIKTDAHAKSGHSRTIQFVATRPTSTAISFCNSNATAIVNTRQLETLTTILCTGLYDVSLGETIVWRISTTLDGGQASDGCGIMDAAVVGRAATKLVWVNFSEGHVWDIDKFGPAGFKFGASKAFQFEFNPISGVLRIATPTKSAVFHIGSQIPHPIPMIKIASKGATVRCDIEMGPTDLW
eukprot:TRINITY_DN23607_c0_g1_i1.p1 TRINITY_DN23607_c0_g1~~TRINITY_DN23607_c0_g1_i1.p1  ORF type:complete len:251 (-),score=20.39 TRINITY_DN23607_c0_g1_i1:31-783(-)